MHWVLKWRITFIHRESHRFFLMLCNLASGHGLIINDKVSSVLSWVVSVNFFNTNDVCYSWLNMNIIYFILRRLKNSLGFSFTLYHYVNNEAESNTKERPKNPANNCCCWRINTVSTVICWQVIIGIVVTTIFSCHNYRITHRYCWFNVSLSLGVGTLSRGTTRIMTS